jgi:HPt (histidine-containing phosphotransfer) domain-containing protein
VPPETAAVPAAITFFGERLTHVNTLHSASVAGPVYSEFAQDPDYRELLELFVGSMAEKRRDFEQCFQGGQTAQLRTLAHQLKGAAGGYGYGGLSLVAKQLESACQSGDLQQIGPALQELLAYLDRVAV